jgi:CheY-like chemotaxis protein
MASDAIPDARMDLLISDVILPGLSGLELCKEVRVAFPEVRAIFMSGYGRGLAPVKEQSLRPGDVWLTKPFSTSRLLSEVHQVLEPDVPLIAAENDETG